VEQCVQLSKSSSHTKCFLVANPCSSEHCQQSHTDFSGQKIVGPEYSIALFVRLKSCGCSTTIPTKFAGNHMGTSGRNRWVHVLILLFCGAIFALLTPLWSLEELDLDSKHICVRLRFGNCSASSSDPSTSDFALLTVS
jgi:hypothetical protein